MNKENKKDVSVVENFDTIIALIIISALFETDLNNIEILHQ